jgi:hypothetical protein
LLVLKDKLALLVKKSHLISGKGRNKNIANYFVSKPPLANSRRPDEFVKKWPKMLPNLLFAKIITKHLLWGKAAQNVGYFGNLKKLSKVNNHPLGENSPNLVTLRGNLQCCNFFYSASIVQIVIVGLALLQPENLGQIGEKMWALKKEKASSWVARPQIRSYEIKFVFCVKKLKREMLTQND